MIILYKSSRPLNPIGCVSDLITWDGKHLLFFYARKYSYSTEINRLNRSTRSLLKNLLHLSTMPFLNALQFESLFLNSHNQFTNRTMNRFTTKYNISINQEILVVKKLANRSLITPLLIHFYVINTHYSFLVQVINVVLFYD